MMNSEDTEMTGDDLSEENNKESTDNSHDNISGQSDPSVYKNDGEIVATTPPCSPPCTPVKERPHTGNRKQESTILEAESETQRQGSGILRSASRTKRIGSGAERRGSGNQVLSSESQKQPGSPTQRPGSRLQRKSSQNQELNLEIDLDTKLERSSSRMQELKSEIQRPESRNQDSGPGTEGSGPEAQRPASSNQELGSGVQRSGSRTQRPSSGNQKPGSGTQRSGSSTQNPASSKPEPGLETQRPGTATEQVTSETLRPRSAVNGQDSVFNTQQLSRIERPGSGLTTVELNSSHPTSTINKDGQNDENVSIQRQTEETCDISSDLPIKGHGEVKIIKVDEQSSRELAEVPIGDNNDNKVDGLFDKAVKVDDEVDLPNIDRSNPDKSSEVSRGESAETINQDELQNQQTASVGSSEDVQQITTNFPKRPGRSHKKPIPATVEEIKERARNLMETLTAIETYDSTETIDTLKSIGRLYWDYKSKRAAVCDVLVATDFAGLAVKYLVSFNKLGIFKSDTVWFPAYYTLNNVWNFTDCSRVLAKEFADKGIIQLMIANITHKPYLENMSSKNVHYVMKSSLSILQNVSKVAEAKQLYLDNDAIQALKPFTTSDNNFLKAVSMMIMTTIINEADNAVLEDTGVIHFMVFGVKNALTAKTRRYRGFTPTELVECLSRMAVNDSNKMKIVTEGALPELVQMLNGSDPAEQASGAQCLWTLSFDKEVRDLILHEPECIERLEQLVVESTLKEVQVATKGAMWKLKNEEQHSSQRAEANKEGEDAPFENHIMISYNWSHQDIILEIVSKLKEDGYRVWVDVDQMGGSTLDAMASAVEKAAVVIVCMSEKYKLSPNCRTEGEYTFQLRKPIVPLLVQRKYRADGWLGMLIGAKLFTDFSGKHAFEKAYGMLVKELKGRGHPNKSPTGNVEPAMVATNQATVNKPPPSAKRSSELLHTWSRERVAQWLKEHKLESCVDQFSELDGRMLSALLTLRTEAPEYFYNTLERKFRMDLHNILHLINAMEALP